MYCIKRERAYVCACKCVCVCLSACMRALEMRERPCGAVVMCIREVFDATEEIFKHTRRHW